MDDVQGNRTIRQVQRRIVPFCILLFAVSFMDRINVGFAALQTNRDIAIGSEAFGLGVGLFFIGYFLFEIPSNLILHRVGARKWIARIVLSWGALTAAHVFVIGPYSFYALRFLLGVAEAGFALGVIYYLTLWFPSRYRGTVMSRYLTASAVAIIVSAPISTSLLQLSGVGSLAGWQWMFLVEGGLGVVLGILTFLILPDRPENATWLTREQRVWLAETLRAEAQNVSRGPERFGTALRDIRVWLQAAIIASRTLPGRESSSGSRKSSIRCTACRSR